MDALILLIFLGVSLPALLAFLFGPFAIRLMEPFFGLSNRLQYFAWRPQRFLLRHPSSWKHKLFLAVFPLRLLYKLTVYMLLAPLRLFNALYYNLVVDLTWRTRDAMLDFWSPKNRRMRRMERDRNRLGYALFWQIGAPYRFLVLFIKVARCIANSLAMVIVDLVFPTLTMYHGTDIRAAIEITKPNEWRVGRGSHAGEGLYFAFDKRVARYYAHQKGGSAIICVRVTLGRNMPMACAPPEVQQMIGNNGRDITEWAREHHLDSIEHWRKDKGWWEYAILLPLRPRPYKIWRVRSLYVVSNGRFRPQRIWDGMSLWLFNLRPFLVFSFALSVLSLSSYLLSAVL